MQQQKTKIVPTKLAPLGIELPAAELKSWQEMGPEELRLHRLRQLKYMLDNHGEIFPEVEFDLECWMKGGSIRNLPVGSTITRGQSCGTAACALGSAAVYAPFLEQGLSLKIEGSFFGGIASPVYGEATTFNAGAAFFGITRAEIGRLFDPSEYPDVVGAISEGDVSARVQGLIDQYSQGAK